MAVILVAYQYTAVKHARFKAFLRGAGLFSQTVVIVENHPTGDTLMQWPKHWKYVRGSNAKFEFSAYQEGLWALKDQVDTTIMVFNDTLFAHHFYTGWAFLIRRCTSKFTNGIYGDPRIEPIEFEGKPLRIYASWHFALIGEMAQKSFKDALQKALDAFDVPIESGAYQAYLHRYLEGSWLRGYTNPGLLNKEGHLARKKHCIYAEHRIGRTLDAQDLLRAYPSRFYLVVRGMDRLFAIVRRMYKRMTSFFS